MTEVITTTVRSASKQVSISRDLPTVIIGERINPTGRKKLQEELKAGNFDTVKADAAAQLEAGAAVLDVNAGVPRADEVSLLVEMIKVLTAITDAPLCIDTANGQFGQWRRREACRRFAVGQGAWSSGDWVGDG
jgi:5-methyltetrahydrofolate--homocysteine methyltransferase